MMHNLDIRKREIMNILEKRKHVTQADLAYALGVNIRTISHDFEYLKQAGYKIIVKRGRYGGGVYLDETR